MEDEEQNLQDQTQQESMQRDQIQKDQGQRDRIRQDTWDGQKERREKNFISCVIYVHNQEAVVSDFLEMLLQVLEEHFEHSEVICVNDVSSDRSVERIRQVSRRAVHTSLSVIHMSYYHGLELAMNAGTELAIGDFVYEFDSMVMDYSPDRIMEIYRRSLEGYDIVSAVPNRRERCSSRLFYRLYERYSMGNQHLQTERFRILSRRVINRISASSKSIPYRKALYAGCGLKTSEVRYEVLPGAASAGNSERSRQAPAGSGTREERRYRLSLATDVLILFTEVGYRFSMTMTVAMLVMSILMVGYSLFAYFVLHPVEGWTTTILFLSVAFFGLFGILTIIVKYLQLLVDMVFKRTHYSFESVEKLT